MKYVLKAILISFVLVLIYSIVSFVIALILYGPGAMMGYRPGILLLPVSLPSRIFDALAPNSLYEMIFFNPVFSVLLQFIFFLCNVLLYSIPVYLILKLFGSKNAD